MSEQLWTDERIVAAFRGSGAGDFVTVGAGGHVTERHAYIVAFCIRDEMQAQIAKRDAEIAYLREWLRGEVTMAEGVCEFCAGAGCMFCLEAQC